MDFIGASKLLLRLATLAWGLILLALYFDSSAWRCRSVNWLFLPWCFFLSWAFLSISWSALKTTSIGQSLGLASQVLLAWLICQVFTDEKSILRFTGHLAHVLMFYSAAFLVIYAIAPETTGLERTERLDAADGLVHPTAMGATSSLGLILLIGMNFVGIVSSRSCVVGIVIQLTVLYISRSRSAMVCAAAVLPWMVLYFRGYRWIPRGLIALAVASCFVLVVDPGFQFAEDALESAARYLKRGQSEQQLAGGSGRVELWQAILGQVQNSPFIGHGYFVTSDNGLLDVWDGAANRDAHNVVLQVLATTGVVGCLILAVAAYRWSIALAVVVQCSTQGRTIGILVLLAMLWYLLWGIGCTTFMGPVRPESVVFFALMGLLARLYENLSPQMPRLASVSVKGRLCP